MANPHKARVLGELRKRFGDVRKVKGSESLFIIGDGMARIYFRYSKLHDRGRTFFGLRDVDLRQLEGHNSFLCFLVDKDIPPLFIPYLDFEEIFHSAQPASDGQYKVQLFSHSNALELYVSRQGRFNVEGYVGMDNLELSIHGQGVPQAKALSHSQVQTLMAGIGHAKGYDVCLPENDIPKLDWSLTKDFQLRRNLPEGFEKVRGILSEIDVVWVAPGRSKVEGLYEIEHSTPIYSGLLRFNDVLLTEPKVSRFSIVSNVTRRDLFSRQLFRPTFRKSGLAELCSFLEYRNVFAWHERLLGGRLDHAS